MGETVKEGILRVVAAHPGIRLADLARRLGKRYQHVRQEVRDLAGRGRVALRREDYLRVYPAATQRLRLPRHAGGDDEDAVKERIRRFLESEGWRVRVRYGRAQGPDVVATRGRRTWIIEVKGMATRRPMFNNYFLAALGSLMQRMRDPGACYSVAFPDHPVYRRLWVGLPETVKRRLGVSAVFVGERIEVVR